jgi:hypothetical protein
MAFNRDKEGIVKVKGVVKVNVVHQPNKEWWEDYTPCEDYLKQISFIASIGTGFTLSASVTLAGSSTFKGATDSATIASVATTAQIFAWGGSAYAVALITAIIGILVTELKSVVELLQRPRKSHKAQSSRINQLTNGTVAKKKELSKGVSRETHANYKDCLHSVFFVAYILLAVFSLGFTAAGTALTGIGLNTLAGGSGTVLQWSLLAVGFPMIVLASLALWSQCMDKNSKGDSANCRCGCGCGCRCECACGRGCKGASEECWCECR